MIEPVASEPGTWHGATEECAGPRWDGSRARRKPSPSSRASRLYSSAPARGGGPDDGSTAVETGRTDQHAVEQPGHRATAGAGAGQRVADAPESLAAVANARGREGRAPGRYAFRSTFCILLAVNGFSHGPSIRAPDLIYLYF